MSATLFSELRKPIAIVGMGVSGTSVKELLLTDGISSNDLLTFDDKSQEADFRNGDELLAKGKPKTLIVSPGVPLQTPWILEAKKNGIVITSELSIASKILTSESLIAITGSIGKSTTTCLLQAALEKFCPSYFVGGNLGIPLAVYAKDLLQKKRQRAQWIVLELSSYQLENFPELKADYSVITYLTPNHLERYTSKNEYYKTKWQLEKHTHKVLVLNKNGGELMSWSREHAPALVKIIWTDHKDPLIKQFSLNDCALLGAHNLDNIAMAAQIIQLNQWPQEAYQGLKEFPGLPHRVENLGWNQDILYINDSKATTMESVKIAIQSALEALKPNKKLHLLLGGRDKNLPWQELKELSSNPSIQFYFFGECRDQAKKLSQLQGPTFPLMIEAAEAARAKAQPGDGILLSPGGTSLDEFKNFEYRGEVFKSFAKANY